LENQVKQVVALVTQAKKEIAPDSDNEGSTCCSKRDPYTVAAWQLAKKEDKVQMHGNLFFGAQTIIGVAALSIMECTLTTKLAIMSRGDLEWMQVTKTGLAMKMMVN
jgi:hypothetical protein